MSALRRSTLVELADICEICVRVKVFVADMNAAVLAYAYRSDGCVPTSHSTKRSMCDKFPCGRSTQDFQAIRSCGDVTLCPRALVKRRLPPVEEIDIVNFESNHLPCCFLVPNALR